MMRTTFKVAVLLLAASPVAAWMPLGYAGEQTRQIKSLSPQEQADLLAGRGMGLARAGELNHYPGPAHVLELRDRLNLSPEQIAAVGASFHRMQETAKPLGTELVERERALDAAFRGGTMTPARLQAVHLAAHIEMRSVLTSAQIATYDTLRGYTDAAVPSAGHQHPMPPG